MDIVGVIHVSVREVEYFCTTTKPTFYLCVYVCVCAIWKRVRQISRSNGGLSVRNRRPAYNLIFQRRRRVWVMVITSRQANQVEARNHQVSTFRKVVSFIYRFKRLSLKIFYQELEHRDLHFRRVNYVSFTF